MFFSVKQPMLIGGKKFVPCICYEVTKYLESTVEVLVEKGKARIHSERVYFQNGKPIEKKEPEPEPELLSVRHKKEKKAHKKEAEAPAEKISFDGVEETLDEDDAISDTDSF